MNKILENEQLPKSEEWFEAAKNHTLKHPLLKQYPNLETILDYGRWAPSGDNMQCWHFKLLDANHFDIHGCDTRQHCVYDLRGHASQISLGMLLENLSLGASIVGQKLAWKLDETSDAEHPVIHISLMAINDDQTDDLAARKALASNVILRSVYRRPLSRQTIKPEHKKRLEQAVIPLKLEKKLSPLKVIWFEGKDLFKTTRLFYKAAGIRLRVPEAFATHADIMEWENNFSREKMPVNTLGASWFARKMMRFALKDWKRVNFLNNYLAGTLLPRIELDVIPSLFSGAHFILIDENKVNESISDFLCSGQLVQRFWLTATSLGLQLQPQMSPLIFANYHRLSINFTTQEMQLRATEKLAKALLDMIDGNSIGSAVFMGRLGYGDMAESRSTRQELNTLCS